MKIALIENFGSDFYSARLRYALFLQEKGHQVIAIVPNDGYVDKIQKAGVETIALNLDIRQRSIKNAYGFHKELKVIFRKEKFDVIHLYRMQPNFIGTFTAYFSSKKSVIVNHITGLGVAFTKSTFKYKLIQRFIRLMYKLNSSLFKANLIFQNYEDKVDIGCERGAAVVKGSAVNESLFNPKVKINAGFKKELSNRFGIDSGMKLIFVSRLLKQKGLSQLIDAVALFNKENRDKKVNLLVAGWIDTNNPDSFTEQEVQMYSQIENVAFLGRRNDINELIEIADVAVLPTFYREGTPRFLLEAMAMGKPIITTDMPGCNHLVKDKRNGLIIKPKNVNEILRAIHEITNSDLEKLGKSSREIYEREFSEKVVYNQLLKAYSTI